MKHLQRIVYHLDGRIMPCRDAAYVEPGDTLADEVAKSVVQTISTDVEITIGGVEIYLCWLLDPDHWSDDWRKALDLDDEQYDDVPGAVEEWLQGHVEDWEPARPVPPETTTINVPIPESPVVVDDGPEATS